MKCLGPIFIILFLSSKSYASIDVLFKAKDEIASKTLLLDSVLELSEELEYSNEQIKNLLLVKEELKSLNEDIGDIEYVHSEALELGTWNATREAELSQKISQITTKIRAVKRLYKSVVAITSIGSVEGGILAETKHSNYYLRDISQSLNENQARESRSEILRQKREKEELRARSSALTELNTSIKKHQKKSGFGF